MASKPLLRMTGISKYFGGLRAVSDVDLELYQGEVLAIVGDNGAGKSTLIKVLTGVYDPDGGSVELNGRKVAVSSRRVAKDLGIEAVYQNLALVDSLDAASNVFLGSELKRRVLGIPILMNGRMREVAQQLLEKRIGVKIDTFDQPVFNLSGGQRQAVAIARAIYNAGVKVLVLDEPTAALGPEETRNTLDLITNLKGKELGIIMISHQLEDVFELADRIMVMRNGYNVGVREVKNTTRQEILGLIVGAELSADAATPARPQVSASASSGGKA